MTALADLLRVMHELRPDGADADRAAELLGLRRTRPPRVPLPGGRAEPSNSEEERAPSTSPRVSPREETPLPISMEWHGAPAAVRPVWLTEPVPAEDLRYRRAQIELEPLLQPLSTRAILSSLASTPDAGAPDIDALVDSIALHEPVRRVRHLLVLTVARGVQVLVDKSPSMAPFRRDQAYVTTALRRVVGTPRVNVIDFIECPTRGAGVGAINRWKSYAPPPPHMPVLLLTDLGIGREHYSGATTTEWLSFAHEVRAAGCLLLSLVPYPPPRWPRALRPLMAIAQWDRSLTARAARRSVLPGRRR